MTEDSQGTDGTIFDLSGLTVEEVAALVKDHELGDGSTSELTRCYRRLDQLGEKYTEVVCVWLNKTWEITEDCKVVDRKDVMIPTFVLWNGKNVRQRHDRDLHGFVKKDGGVDWGLANTHYVIEWGG